MLRCPRHELSTPDPAAILEQALDRRVKLVDTPPTFAGDQMLAGGMDPDAVDQIVARSARARRPQHRRDRGRCLDRGPAAHVVQAWAKLNSAAFDAAPLRDDRAAAYLLSAIELRHGGHER